MGFQGSGKTYTATLIANGLLDIIYKLTGEKAKCAFFDTENGSDFVAPMFEHAGYELVVARSRAFVDLVKAFKVAKEAGAEVMIIDSISHVWRDVMESYMEEKGRSRLEFHDWSQIKTRWRQYVDLFITFPMHVIVCGRAGYEYAFEENEDGKKELRKTGTKMKVEGEFGYEPSLVLEMTSVRRDKDGKRGAGVIENVCTVLKDRSDKINGMEFVSPTFQDFGPHWDYLALGGEHCAVDITRNSRELFRTAGEWNWRKRKIDHDALIEDIKGEFVRAGLGSSAKEKAFKAHISLECFGTDNWVRIENELNSQVLKEGVELMQDAMEELLAAFAQSSDGRVDVKGIVAQHRAHLEQQRKDDDLPFDDILANKGNQGEQEEQDQQQDRQGDDGGQDTLW